MQVAQRFLKLPNISIRKCHTPGFWFSYKVGPKTTYRIIAPLKRGYNPMLPIDFHPFIGIPMSLHV